MGWFSHLKKDKQGPGEAEGAYVARSEDASVRSRAKRGSGKTANEPVDPVLPEKKRARRRLVGAIALALAVIIGLPMVLDSEPKPLSGDIAIQIPSKDKPYSASDATARPRSSVPAEQALDQGEEIVNLPGNASAASAASASASPPARASVAAPATLVADKPVAAKPPEVKPAEAKPTKPVEAKPTEPKPAKPAEAKPAEPKPAEPKPTEHKPEPKPAEPKPTKPAEAKPAEPKPSKPVEAKPVEPKPVPNPEGAATPRHDGDNAERAKALLEGKPDGRPDGKPDGRPEPKPTRFVVQVAALATQEKIDELQGKLRAAGITSHTQKVATDSGPRTRIRVGPFSDKDEASRMRDKLIKLGLNGTLIPQ